MSQLLRERKETPSPPPFPLQLFESECESRSVVSDSLWPHGLYSPWSSPGQNTGVGSLSLPQGIFPTQGLNPVIYLNWIKKTTTKLFLNSEVIYQNMKPHPLS